MAHMSPKEIKQLPAARALLYAGGLTDEDIDKPIVGIFGGHNNICPGHGNVAEAAEYIAQGVREAGGTPRIMLCVPGVCDGIAMGHDGMKFSLLTRWLTVNTIEAMYRAHGVFEGAAIISACDKNGPGSLMAAARLDEPTVIFTPGPMWPGEFEGKKYDVVSAFGLRSELNLGFIDEKRYREVMSHCCEGYGKCSGNFTANTIGISTESMGLCLPYEAATPAVEKEDQHKMHHEQIEQAIESGRLIMRLIAEGMNARKFMTMAAFLNAYKVDMAMSGSTNLALHLPEIAAEAGVELPLDMINEISEQVAHIVKMSPASVDRKKGVKHWMDDLYRAGGVPAVMNELRDLLDLSVPVVEGGTLEQRLANAKNTNPEVIRHIDNAYSHTGGMEVYKGTLCPEGAVIKVGGMSDKVAEVAEYTAVVFECEEEATKFIEKPGNVEPGMAIFIRNEGEISGPGMREMLYPTTALSKLKTEDGEPMDAYVALITTGRFSGGTIGLCFGHAAPEDGPIALVKNGDKIRIDTKSRRIDLLVDDNEMELRKTFYVPGSKWQPVPERSVLRDYRRHVLAGRG
jgi:dihydroxy-acid dehydratase